VALKQIKNKIVATKKTGKVTKAMESVSAVKMRKSQERAFLSRPYVLGALSILERLIAATRDTTHPLMVKRPTGRVLAVIVTSDKGLAGSVNSAVLKQAERLFKAEPAVDVIAFGRKAVEFARREGKTLVAEFTNVADGVTLADVEAAAGLLLATYVEGSYKEAVIIHQNFISTFEQAPTLRHVLPLRAEAVHQIALDIAPRVGKYSERVGAAAAPREYTIEPSAEVVLGILIPQLVQVVLYHALLESKASEHSARMVAMKNATDKSKEVVKALTIKFNKQRQAAITAEVSEITAGVEAMK
jgi:F-type H+-transporting ATPase subunit gamma